MSEHELTMLLARLSTMEAEIKALRDEVKALQSWRAFALGAWAAIATAGTVVGWLFRH